METKSNREAEKDIQILRDFAGIYCHDLHVGRQRVFISDGSKVCLCYECQQHLEYAAQRRLRCPQNPKPFCSSCPKRCYSKAEAEWQRSIMKHSGPKFWRHGHILSGIKHMLQQRQLNGFK